MARPSLRDVAAELSASDLLSGADDAQERAGRLADLIRAEHPDREWKVRSIQNAAAKAVGAETPDELAGRADEATRPRSKSKRSKKRRRRARRLTPPRVKLASATSFGSLFAQMLGLVALYWVIRSGGAVANILDRVGNAVRWVVQPVGWGSSPSEAGGVLSGAPPSLEGSGPR